MACGLSQWHAEVLREGVCVTRCHLHCTEYGRRAQSEAPLCALHCIGRGTAAASHSRSYDIIMSEVGGSGEHARTSMHTH